MSLWVRTKNADNFGNVECFTCGKQMHYKEAHAGHFKHSRLDFDPMNINVQCPGCNTYRGGKLDVYAIKLVKMYGLEAVEDLDRRAARHTGYTYNELLEIIENLKQK